MHFLTSLITLSILFLNFSTITLADSTSNRKGNQFDRPAQTDAQAFERPMNFKEACNKKGGEVDEMTIEDANGEKNIDVCMCTEMSYAVYINPEFQTCLNTVLKEVGMPLMENKPYCHLQYCEATKPYFDKVNKKMLCQDPAKTVCDPGMNPAIDLIGQSVTEFYSVAGTIESDREVIKLLFTEERKKTAQTLFDKAKKQMTEYLLKLDLPEATKKKIQARMEKTLLMFNKPVGEPWDFNLQTCMVELECSQQVYDDRIYMNAGILLADANPEQLYYGFLHEFGHVVDSIPELKQKFNPVRTCLSEKSKIPEKQLLEGFPDWVATEVFSQNLDSKLFSEVAASQALLCFHHLNNPGKENDELAAHPSGSKRVSDIFSANPKIRSEVLGCEVKEKTSEGPYCAL